MSYRVQFTISDSEHEELKKQAEKDSYPNVAELCKSRSLQPVTNKRRDYAELYRIMVQKIEELPSGAKFFLRDLVDTPPALLGRWLFDNVANGTIKGVKHLGNDGSDAEQYLKQ